MSCSRNLFRRSAQCLKEEFSRRVIGFLLKDNFMLLVFQRTRVLWILSSFHKRHQLLAQPLRLGHARRFGMMRIIAMIRCAASSHACLNSSQSRSSWRMILRSVPIFKSLLPQSGTGTTLPLTGLCHLRWEPPDRRGISSQPSFRNFFATSKYFKLPPSLE